MPVHTMKCGEYVVGQLIYYFGTKKECNKNFVGQIIRTDSGKFRDKLEVKFMRKVRMSNIDQEAEYHFVFPNINDTWHLEVDQIVEKVSLIKVQKSKLYFDLSSLVTKIDDIE